MTYETDYSMELSGIGSAIGSLAERVGNVAEMLDLHQCGKPNAGAVVLPAQSGDVQVIYYAHEGGSYWTSLEVPILAWEFLSDKCVARTAGSLPERDGGLPRLMLVHCRGAQIVSQSSWHVRDNWVGGIRSEFESFLNRTFNWRQHTGRRINAATTLEALEAVDDDIDLDGFILPEWFDSEGEPLISDLEMNRRVHDKLRDETQGGKDIDLYMVLSAYLKAHDQLTEQSQSQKIAPTHEGEARK